MKIKLMKRKYYQLKNYANFSKIKKASLMFIVAIIFFVTISLIYSLIININYLHRDFLVVEGKDRGSQYFYHFFYNLRYTFLASFFCLFFKEFFYMFSVLVKNLEIMLFKLLEQLYSTNNINYLKTNWYYLYKRFGARGKPDLTLSQRSVDFYLKRVFDYDCQPIETQRILKTIIKGKKIFRFKPFRRFYFDNFGHPKEYMHIVKLKSLLTESVTNKNVNSVFQRYVSYYQKKRPIIETLSTWFEKDEVVYLKSKMAWMNIAQVSNGAFRVISDLLVFYDTPFVFQFVCVFFVSIVMFWSIFSFFLLYY